MTLIKGTGVMKTSEEIKKNYRAKNRLWQPGTKSKS